MEELDYTTLPIALLSHSKHFSKNHENAFVRSVLPSMRKKNCLPPLIFILIHILLECPKQISIIQISSHVRTLSFGACSFGKGQDLNHWARFCFRILFFGGIYNDLGARLLNSITLTHAFSLWANINGIGYDFSIVLFLFEVW